MRYNEAGLRTGKSSVGRTRSVGTSQRSVLLLISEVFVLLLYLTFAQGCAWPDEV